MLATLWRHRSLIMQMAWRDIAARYRGSVMGVFWSLLNPLLMLAVYTFVFSVVFKARWQAGAEQSHADFAVILFAGVIVHSFFAEVAGKAPSLILTNPSYVKKVVFPLEILPAVTLLSALFQAGISFLVLLAALLITIGSIPFTVPLILIVWLPLCLLALGASWWLSSLGVYIRDIGQAIGVVLTVMLFISPAFFSIQALPESLQPWVKLNPLTLPMEQSRQVLIWGTMPDWGAWALYTLLTAGFAWLGFAWFQSTRRGFADVL
ncbi:MAG: ABC transporter permease [Lautropia sp.]|nr:ABC transporter permease [Lautropia sp.]